MSKIILNDITNLNQISLLNANFDKIEEWIDDKGLSRDNPSGDPNQMEEDLDMNGKRIYNLPEPVSPSEAARLQDVADIAAGVVTSVEGVPGRTTSSGGQTPVIDLDVSGVTPGTYTGATLTIDEYGRVTLVTPALNVLIAFVLGVSPHVESFVGPATFISNNWSGMVYV